MYCSCLRPFPVQNIANGEKFTVCVSNKGGCGLEIKVKEEVIPYIVVNPFEFSYGELFGNCLSCQGTGVSKRDLITCSTCNGTGLFV